VPAAPSRRDTDTPTSSARVPRQGGDGQHPRPDDAQYQQFDKWAAKKFVLDPHGAVEAAAECRRRELALIRPAWRRAVGMP
jgi:hypothetical protein